MGITALFIAAKYEEVFPPIMNDFVKICDKIYTNRDIIRMEMSILKRLNFELGRPLPIHFLRRFSKAAHADSVIHNIAKYLMELSLLEYQCASWEPSLIAATALYVSLKSVDSSQKWTKTLAHYTQFTEEQLKPYVTILCNIIIQAPASKLQVSILLLILITSQITMSVSPRIVVKNMHLPNLTELVSVTNWNLR